MYTPNDTKKVRKWLRRRTADFHNNMWKYDLNSYIFYCRWEKATTLDSSRITAEEGKERIRKRYVNHQKIFDEVDKEYSSS